MNPPDQPIEQTDSVGGARPATDGPQTVCGNQSIGAAQQQAAETAEDLHKNLFDQQKQAGAFMNEAHIKRIKALRMQLDAILQQMKTLLDSREVALSYTRVQEAIMWLGMELKSCGTPNPYPHSYDPRNAIIDPTADGLRL